MLYVEIWKTDGSLEIKTHQPAKRKLVLLSSRKLNKGYESYRWDIKGQVAPSPSQLAEDFPSLFGMVSTLRSSPAPDFPRPITLLSKTENWNLKKLLAHFSPQKSLNRNKDSLLAKESQGAQKKEHTTAWQDLGVAAGVGVAEPRSWMPQRLRWSAGDGIRYLWLKRQCDIYNLPVQLTFPWLHRGKRTDSHPNGQVAPSPDGEGPASSTCS